MIRWYLNIAVTIIRFYRNIERRALIDEAQVNTQAAANTGEELGGVDSTVLKTSLVTVATPRPTPPTHKHIRTLPIQAQHSISLHDDRVSSSGRALLWELLPLPPFIDAHKRAGRGHSQDTDAGEAETWQRMFVPYDKQAYECVPQKERARCLSRLNSRPVASPVLFKLL